MTEILKLKVAKTLAIFSSIRSLVYLNTELFFVAALGVFYNSNKVKSCSTF